MIHSKIYQVKKIGLGCLSVMAKPVSGEFVEQEFSDIAAQGVDCIVSLLELREANDIGLKLEQSLAEKNSIEFISFPIPDRGLPSSVSQFSDFTSKLHNDIVSGKHTVIHCRAGIGRTGLVSAGVLLHSGLNVAEAFKLVSQKRGTLVPDTQEQQDWLFSHYKRIISTPK
ncbi:hypothetical protein MNBD_GAMMA12-3149 [hydrothermal vent metagenome]|uniref:Tyrosine specific protein phosphatases domain-containing protein n=1 Tax=hydrothermal vent metagenome TaxID=652676 RepID=A0A3B0YG39_9ZZZZ